MSSPPDIAFQKPLCPDNEETFDIRQVLPPVTGLGGLLDVAYDWDRVPVPASLREFEARWGNRRNPLDFSGVWRFRELLPFAAEQDVVTIGEGQTLFRQSDRVGRFAGMDAGSLFLQYEGLNPSGSFKDNGMTAATTHAKMVGARRTACASTGNTSASLAIYAGTSGLFQCIVFIGSGQIAFGKLSQALDYGAHTIQIDGDFDDALVRVREVCDQAGIYLCNSVNPFRLEGQKAIMYRVLEGLHWEVPDWIIVPGGNLGNSSAFGKAFLELKELGLIDRIPRMAVINASGANSLYRLYEQEGLRWNDGHPCEDLVTKFYQEMDKENRRAQTLATAIQINRPVNLLKCLRALDACDGLVREVGDQEILDAKAAIGAGGLGCEPASAASLAGVKLLRNQGQIAPGDRVVCILTGHQLKDPDATIAYHRADFSQFASDERWSGVTTAPLSNRPISVPNDLEAIMRVLPAITDTP